METARVVMRPVGRPRRAPLRLASIAQRLQEMRQVATQREVMERAATRLLAQLAAVGPPAVQQVVRELAAARLEALQHRAMLARVEEEASVPPSAAEAAEVDQPPAAAPQAAKPSAARAQEAQQRRAMLTAVEEVAPLLRPQTAATLRARVDRLLAEAEQEETEQAATPRAEP